MGSSSRVLTMEELNKTALEQFIYQPVGRDMISYLAMAAQQVIVCDPTVATAQKDLPPTPPRTPESQCSTPDDKAMPTLEEFITKLVVSSNVQVPTLMSTLVYLTRLKSRLQPQARGLKCTTHRIFLASLILSAKYLNDSSPKNKHWANYTNICTEYYQFGFNRTEVNLMEKQLLFLLEWDLRISEEDLYRELDFFLDPLRQKISERHARKIQQREERRRQNEMHARRYPSPASSRGHSRSRTSSPEHVRSASHGSITPPGLSYSSSASSYASSVSSSRQHSRAATPLESEVDSYSYDGVMQGSLYDSPVQIVMESEPPKAHLANGRMLPYEISEEQYQQLQEESMAKKRQKRGVWGRILGTAVAAR